ncbi:MAG: hypothetical protein A2096_14510 [Spirochaetes bacterium GWF1_41_5]|nr:MAG: hypothetical protein A2096_14510 [Spirochaetes bacterium GWF1_41_5]
MIMIIDDNKEVCNLTSDVLISYGFNTGVYYNAESAIAELEKYFDKYSVIVCDWVMAGIDGLSFARKIKKHNEWAYIPFVLMSGHNFSSDEIRAAIDAGIFFFLKKPCSSTFLYFIVKSAENEYIKFRSINKKISEYLNILPLFRNFTVYLKTFSEGANLSNWLAHLCGNCQHGAIALYELICNAIEHGNLGISYQEKTVLLAQDRYSGEIDRRSALAENSEKFVKITFNREDNDIEIVIEDQGTGFDYKKYLEPDPKSLYDMHGLGITIVRQYFNIEYSDPGNKVTVKLTADCRNI